MIADTFINRPVTAIVISLIIVIVGILALLNLPVGQYPEITPPQVTVSGIYSGADAQTVEQTTTTPIEVQVNGSTGMSYIQSNSTSDGRTSISVSYDIGTNIDIAALDVQNRVGVATPQLPDDVKRLGLIVRKRSPGILLIVSIYSPNGTHSKSFIDNYSTIFIKDALLRTKGVGDIFVGADDFSMRVWLKPDKMASLGINANDIVTALQEQNLQVATGSVGGPPQQSQQTFEYLVFSNNRISKTDEFENIIIRTSPASGSVVYLKDVARVELGKFNYSSNFFVDGKKAAFLLLFQTPESNALETAKRVTETMEQLKKSFPSDIDYIVPFESVTIVRSSIHEVVETLVIALLLVTFVVFLFLQNIRATLIPILAIPVSIIGTFVFFIPLHFTVNTLTLFGFVLAIGIVVDDAIIVVEAVQHYIDEEKISAKEAATKAMKDISGPVVAIALILAAVFVPVGFIPGIVGRLYQQFAITIAISVLISAFVALSLTPALCSILLKPTVINTKSRGLNKFFYSYNKWFNRMTENYTNAVRKAIKATPYVVVMMACIIVGTFFLFKNKPTGFIPPEDIGRLYITYELPEASSTTQSLQMLDSIMNILKSIPEVNHFAAVGGLNAITFAFKSNSGALFVQLKDWNERKDKSQQLNAILGKLQQRFSSLHSANIFVIPPPAIPGLGSTGGFSFVLQQRESTDDINAFENVLHNFLAEANKRPEIARAFCFFTARTPGYFVDVDRVKAKRMGVAVSDVYATIQTFLGGRYVNDFTTYGRNFRVIAQADSLYRGDVQDLQNYYVRNMSGEMVPLSAVTSYKVVESAPLISHFNLFRSAEINGDAKEGYSSGQAIEALRDVAAKVLPTGYGYEFSGMSREEINAGSGMIIIFILSIGFVFLFLAALYESWSVPFSVLLAVPLGAFGAIAALTLAPSLSNNVYAQIGLVTLIGLSAKNAILIVEFSKTRVDAGMPLIQSTLEASKLRLRPILMTSLAFIFGVLPLIFATGAGAVARQTIGYTVFGGMTAATMFAIFTVPVLFVLITKIVFKGSKL